MSIETLDGDTTLEQRLAAIRGVVFDIDGCLMLSSRPAGGDGAALPGAVEAVRAIRDGGRPVLAFTNASARPPEAIRGTLNELGFGFGVDEVLTPAVVAADVVRERYGDQPVLAFGGDGVVGVLRARGVTLAEMGSTDSVAAVVVGWDVEFDQPKLQAAAEALWAGAPLLITSDAPAFATRGRRSAGVSGFIAAGLSHVTGSSYEVVGKPSRLAVNAIRDRFGVTADQILVAGDDLSLEVAMARSAGGIGVLVTTGMHGRDEAAAAVGDRRPHLIVDSLTELSAVLNG